MVDAIVISVIVWAVVGCIIVGAMSDDSEMETRHFVMGFFWPITVSVFLIIGPIFALYAALRACLGMFKD